ncbi:E3 ubiquitin-protein ligase TRIM7-like isoform X2 [Paroedura picta]|uniref:E3 ubiquitin-protein ligase TRIM7-like isoform X2 n=1 Tax=Paroedura picta TaxID=143630 RepID=UPI004057BD7E
MATEGALRELCEELTCSICLDFFREPVTVPECGHSFCRACLAQAWEEPGAQPSCPQCRKRAQKRKLHPNLQLANVVEIAKRFRPVEAEAAEGRGGDCEKHREPLKFFCREDKAPLCVVCGKSRKHRGHQVTPLEEADGKKTILAVIGEESVCQNHREPLKLFCRDHDVPLCLVCEQSQEHKYHEIVPAEEALQEYKDQFCSSGEILKKERDKILACKGSVVKESQDLLKQTKGEQQKTVTKFRQLHLLLEEQEKLLLAQMEEVEKEVEKKRDQHLARLIEELSSLDSLIGELEEKSEQPAGDLLQNPGRILQRYKEKELFGNLEAFPVALKWRTWDFSDFNHILEGFTKQFRANVTLDPDTAYMRLILSDGQKSMKLGGVPFQQCKNPERFDLYPCVLGSEGFRAGRHFWEVLVASEEEWMVGVARKSVKRKGTINFSPKEGIWTVGKWEGGIKASVEGHPLLTLSGELKRIRVGLNYAGGRVAFFDADTAALLYEFSEVSFSGETLLPFFYVYENGHLKIST